MSATADAGLFAAYFEQALGTPSGQLTIPGFTHPVTGELSRVAVPARVLCEGAPGMCAGTNGVPCARPSNPCVSCSLSLSLPLNPQPDMFLEDALEATGLMIGKTSKWAKRSGGGGKHGGGGGKDAGDGSGGGAAAAALGGYSEPTRISLSNVDEALINTDLIEALVAHVISTRQQQGGRGGGKKGGGDNASAILIFAPGTGLCVWGGACRCCPRLTRNMLLPPADPPG